MNIESLITQSSNHFEKHYGNKRSASVVFVHYMIEEFQQYPQVENLLNRRRIDPQLPMHRKFKLTTDPFYVWYYFNYASIPKEAVDAHRRQWDAPEWKIDFDYLETSVQFDNIIIQPVRSIQNEDIITYEPCESQYAELWAVYANSTSGPFVNIARCKNEITAYTFASNLKTLIMNWEIKVLLDIKDASIQNIYANHQLKFASIDRDVLENKSENDKLDMLREHSVSSDAQAGEFYKSIPIHDNEDEIVRELLEEISF